jgi:outer membrane protein assembly factor BamB
MVINRSIALCLMLAGCGGPTTYRAGDGGNGGGPDGSSTFDFAAPVCSPNDPPSCDGTSIQTCRSDGSGYDYSPCAVGCANGVCTCNPGDLQCVGQDAQKCDGNGAWQTIQTCPMGTQCQAGVCGDPRCADEMMSTNPHALPTNAWPRFRHDNRNTGSTPTAVAALPKMKWKTFIGGSSYGGALGGLVSGPVVNQDNVIFIGGGDSDGAGGQYHSLDSKGVIKWSFPGMRGLGLSTPAVRADATSYFASSAALLFAVDPTGKEVWRFTVGSVSDSDPIITHDGTLIYSSDDGSVYALDATGKLMWKSDPQNGPGEVDGGIAETCDGKLIVPGKNGWFKMDVTNGAVIWKVPATGTWGALLSAPQVTADGTVYGWDFGGMGYAIDVNGKVIWQKQFTANGDSAGAAVAKIGTTLYTVLNDGNLYAVDAANGNTKWMKPVGDGKSVFLLAGPVVDGNNHIYFNSQDGNLYAFDAGGNPLWKIPHSGKANSGYSWAGDIAIGNDGTMYVPGNDGNLYAFQ